MKIVINDNSYYIRCASSRLILSGVSSFFVIKNSRFLGKLSNQQGKLRLRMFSASCLE